MFPIFVIKFSGVSDLQGVKVPVFPLTAGHRYNSAALPRSLWLHTLRLSSRVNRPNRDIRPVFVSRFSTFLSACGTWIYRLLPALHAHLSCTILLNYEECVLLEKKKKTECIRCLSGALRIGLSCRGSSVVVRGVAQSYVMWKILKLILPVIPQYYFHFGRGGYFVKSVPGGR